MSIIIMFIMFIVGVAIFSTVVKTASTSVYFLIGGSYLALMALVSLILGTFEGVI